MKLIKSHETEADNNGNYRRVQIFDKQDGNFILDVTKRNDSTPYGDSFSEEFKSKEEALKRFDKLVDGIGN